MAGGTAEAKYLNKSKLSRGCNVDRHHLVKINEQIGIVGKSLEYYSGYIIEEAKRLFEIQLLWDYVNRLAGILVDKKKIDYKQCKQLYSDVLGGLHFDTGSKTVNQRFIMPY